MTVVACPEKRRPAGWWCRLGPLLALIVAILTAPGNAHALKPIVVDPETDRLELTTLGDLYEGRGDSIQLETAPSADGSTGRMSVNAVTAGTNPNWIVFALTNPTDRALERWLTADRYSVVGSGVIWPDLDARRLEAVTPSIGYVPERIPSERADIFRITLEPGQTITYVAELTTDRFARIHLWKPLEYELKVRDRQLFNGVMLGLTGLLAIFLTAIFAANHKLIFPAGALVAWCVLGLLCVDFGFFHKLFQLKAEDNAIYRAATESALAASLVIFLHVFLRLALWHGIVRMLVGTWMVAQLALIAIAVVDPRLASTFARISFLLIGLVGAGLTLFLAIRGQDRALSLIPTLLLYCVWVFGAGLVLTGRIPGDIAVSGLVAGLVLILLLIGFTVTQFAFRSLEPVFGSSTSDLQTRALAVDGAGAAVWEWSARRDEFKIGQLVENMLGLNPGELSCKTDDFVRHMHPADRERFRLLLWSTQERPGGKLHTTVRLRHADNTFRWLEFDAASIPGSDGRTPKCVGLVRDVTEAKHSHERLVHDAVHDSLTGFPNRELFLDRLGVALERAKTESHIRPAVILIDIDKFKSVNTTFGLVVGDSLLLAAARRLQRHLGAQDTLARIGGDQFALLFPREQKPEELAHLAEQIRRSLRSPVKIADQELVLTGALGVAQLTGEATQYDLFKDAEVAMYRAKRAGADRIEIFKPEMRGVRDDRVTIESDLRKALEKAQLRVLYQPIIYLPTEELAGFEALVRWEHPKLGTLNPGSFVPVAEESDLIVKLGSYVLSRAARDAAKWQKEMPRPERPLFVSVNVSSRQLFRPDLIQEIRHILGQNLVPRGSLRLEVTESLVMENPEQAVEVLDWLRSAGADLALDDFGTGYSSLAYLHRLPCDTIKIDKSLLRTRGVRDGTGAAIVRSMVALAHELDKKVVAEGVETPEDVSFLRGIGCEYAQGFYYGEPVPDREVVQLIRIIRKSERKLQPKSFFAKRRKKPVGADGAQAGSSVNGAAMPLGNGSDHPAPPVDTGMQPSTPFEGEEIPSGMPPPVAAQSKGEPGPGPFNGSWPPPSVPPFQGAPTAGPPRGGPPPLPNAPLAGERASGLITELPEMPLVSGRAADAGEAGSRDIGFDAGGGEPMPGLATNHGPPPGYDGQPVANVVPATPFGIASATGYTVPAAEPLPVAPPAEMLDQVPPLQPQSAPPGIGAVDQSADVASTGLVVEPSHVYDAPVDTAAVGPAVVPADAAHAVSAPSGPPPQPAAPMQSGPGASVVRLRPASAPFPRPTSHGGSQRPKIDLSRLPPNVAASLARLAGAPLPEPEPEPGPDDDGSDRS